MARSGRSILVQLNQDGSNRQLFADLDGLNHPNIATHYDLEGVDGTDP